MDPMQDLVRRLLAALGEDPTREGLLETPRRVEQSLRFLTSGYDVDIDDVINGALFTVPYNEMVIVRDIDLYSLCEHHLLPFFGKAHVAYIPDGKVIGLSKVPRIVDAFARRLQVQERLTSQIAATIEEKVATQPIYHKNLVAADGRAAAINIFFGDRAAISSASWLRMCRGDGSTTAWVASRRSPSKRKSRSQ